MALNPPLRPTTFKPHGSPAYERLLAEFAEKRKETPFQTAADLDWVVKINRSLEKARADEGADAWAELSIYRIPQWLRNSDKKAYIPQMVSLGPYHHGDKQLSGMERHKWRALNHVLERNGHRIERYLDALKEIEEEARTCYEGPIHLSNNDFVEMLVLDSTFILELFRGYNQGFGRLHYSSSDPIFTMDFAMSSIQGDMIMLENQIPLFVLDKIHHIQSHGDSDSASVAKLALQFFNPLVPAAVELPSAWILSKQGGLPEPALRGVEPELRAPIFWGPQNLDQPCWPHHCLEVFWRGLTVRQENKAEHVSNQRAQAHLVAGANQEMEQNNSQQHTGRVARAVTHFLEVFRRGRLAVRENGPVMHWQPMIHCVTELKEAGVKFQAKENANKIYDIDFNDGVLEIPRLVVHKGTKSLLLNLIAFEQCDRDCTNDITSYAIFLDRLINSSADVTYLHRCGILENCLGSDAEVAELFNGLCHEVTFYIGYSWLSDLTEKVNKYYGKSWNEWRANLMHNYFNNPWSTISFIAATILVLLTLAQTFYAVYAYYAPSS